MPAQLVQHWMCNSKIVGLGPLDGKGVFFFSSTLIHFHLHYNPYTLVKNNVLYALLCFIRLCVKKITRFSNHYFAFTITHYGDYYLHEQSIFIVDQLTITDLFILLL